MVAGQRAEGTATMSDVRRICSTTLSPLTVLTWTCHPCCAAAAFLEFHEPLAAWLHPATQGPSQDDTLLASGEVYNNFVRMDVLFKAPKA